MRTPFSSLSLSLSLPHHTPPSHPHTHTQRRASKIVIGASLAQPRAGATGGGGRAPDLPKSSVGGKRVRVLVCAPSNTAVDELVYRLHVHGVLGRCRALLNPSPLPLSPLPLCPCLRRTMIQCGRRWQCGRLLTTFCCLAATGGVSPA